MTLLSPRPLTDSGVQIYVFKIGVELERCLLVYPTLMGGCWDTEEAICVVIHAKLDLSPYQNHHLLKMKDRLQQV